MTRPSDPPPSKGMAIIASYRAARLSQRPALRTSLQQSRLALRRGRDAQHDAAEPVAEPASLPPSDPLPPKAAETGSVFAGLVSLAIAARQSGAPDTVDAPDPLAAVAPAASPPATGPQATGPQATGKPATNTLATDAPPPEVPPAAAGEASAEVETPSAPPPEARPEAPPEAPPEAQVFPEFTAEAAPPAAREAALPVDPPLAEIGFGPGMLIRLSQLGLHTIGDLAQADPAALRLALGDISRLVDVETWISNARQTTASAG
jgi:hypothetical protein